jgi:hypothetical protein
MNPKDIITNCNKNPLVLALAEGVIEKIEQQCQRLEALALKENDAQESARAMAEGAKIALYALQDTSLDVAGTDRWIKNLSVSQLRYASEAVTKELERRQKEGYVKIYTARLPLGKTKYFLSIDDAADYFHKALPGILLQNQKTFTTIDNDDIVMESMRVPRQEVKDCVDHENIDDNILRNDELWEEYYAPIKARNAASKWRF